MADDLDDNKEPDGYQGPGGTPGGLLEFVIGLGLLALGGYLVMSRVVVYSGFPAWFGDHSFGISMLPVLFGIGVLFFNGKSILGWALTALGLLVIFAGVIASLSIAFQPTNLFNVLIIFGLVAGGLGLLARALRAH
ncbi:MAG TPA: hypothetical protein PLF26_09140 [Blastocatellia bacterium]|nr:hypothetical protein [Blastocatellia bacterium]